MLKPRYENMNLEGLTLKQQLNIENKRTPPPTIDENKIFKKAKSKMVKKKVRKKRGMKKRKCDCGCM